MNNGGAGCGGNACELVVVLMLKAGFASATGGVLVVDDDEVVCGAGGGNCTLPKTDLGVVLNTDEGAGAPKVGPPKTETGPPNGFGPVRLLKADVWGCSGGVGCWTEGWPKIEDGAGRGLASKDCILGDVVNCCGRGAGAGCDASVTDNGLDIPSMISDSVSSPRMSSIPSTVPVPKSTSMIHATRYIITTLFCSRRTKASSPNIDIPSASTFSVEVLVMGALLFCTHWRNLVVSVNTG